MKETIARLLGRRRLRPQTLHVTGPADLVEAAHWIEPAPLRMEVPAGLLRMQGAFAYGPDHPFVQALQHGEEALAAFYARVQPRDLAGYYGISARGRKGEDLPPWELPWHKRARRLPPPGEAGLPAEDGVSFYGPVTQRKVATELARLRSAAASIQRHGYDPDRHGDIEGYVMRLGDDACFLVRGGKHRTAALAFLGRETIPVCFRGTLPRIVDGAQAACWPLVRSGAIDVALARDVLHAYLHPSSKDTPE